MKRINQISKLILASAIGLSEMLFSAYTPDNTERITAEPGIVDTPSIADQPATPVPEQYEINTVVEELTNTGSFSLRDFLIYTFSLNANLYLPQEESMIYKLLY